MKNFTQRDVLVSTTLAVMTFMILANVIDNIFFVVLLSVTMFFASLPDRTQPVFFKRKVIEPMHTRTTVKFQNTPYTDESMLI